MSEYRNEKNISNKNLLFYNIKYDSFLFYYFFKWNPVCPRAQR